MSFDTDHPSRTGSGFSGASSDIDSLADLLHDLRRIRRQVRSTSSPPEHVLADLLVHQAEVRADCRVRTQGWSGLFHWIDGSRLWGRVTAVAALGLLLLGGGWLENGVESDMRSAGGVVVDSLFGGPARGEVTVPETRVETRTVEFADSMAANENVLDPLARTSDPED